MIALRSSLPPLILVLAGILLFSCGQRGRPALHQDLQAEAARAAYGRYVRILEDGDTAALPWVHRDPRRARCFLLQGDHARACEGLDPGTTPWHEAVATFFVAPGTPPAAEHGGVWLFDPRQERLLSIAESGEQAEFTLYRALSTAALPGVDDRLRIHRHRFAIAPDGTITPIDGAAIDSGPGDALMPVALPEAGCVVFQRNTPGGGSQLLALDLASGQERALTDPALVSAARLPVQLDAQHVAFVGDVGAGPELLQLDVMDGSIAACDAERIPQGIDQGLLVLAPEDAALVPVLVTLPARLELEQIMQLGRCRSPSVARRRALVAAALAEAGRQPLRSWPTLNAGLAYTPAVGLLTDPSGAGSGDFLGENLVRVLAGIALPLVNWNRNAALEAAALERARIAALLAEAEGITAATRVGENALHLLQHRREAELAAGITEAARARLAIMEHRRAADEATSADLLRAQAEVEDAELALELIAKRIQQREAELNRQLGLDPRTRFEIAEPRFAFAALADQPRERLQRLAALRQPRLRAAARSVEEAFLSAKADRPAAPQLVAAARYGHTRDGLDEAVDDYLGLSLEGRLPLAAGRDQALARDQATHIQRALRAAEVEERAVVADRVDQHWLELAVAAASGPVLDRQQQVAEEQLRIDRLRAEHRAGADGLDALRSVAASEHRLGELRMARLANHAEVGVQALRLLAELGIDPAAADELALTRPLLESSSAGSILIQPFTTSDRHILPLEPAGSDRRIMIDLAPLAGQPPEAAAELLAGTLVRLPPGDELWAVVHDRQLLRPLLAHHRLTSPLERRFDGVVFTGEAASGPPATSQELPPMFAVEFTPAAPDPVSNPALQAADLGDGTL